MPIMTGSGATELKSIGRNQEMMGIKGIVDNVNPPTKSGGLQGIDVATVDLWKAFVDDAGGTPRQLDIQLMQTVFHRVDQLGDGDITLLAGSHGVHLEYQGLLTAQNRYVNTMTLDGGFEYLEYNGRPFVYDKDAPVGFLFFLDENSFAIYRMSDFFWLDKDGSVLRRLDDRDAYQATLALYAELAVDARNRHGVIEDLIDPLP